MPRYLTIFFLLVALCALAHAADPPMTKIIAQMIVPDITGKPVVAKPKTIYRAGEKYARVEEEADLEARSQQLLVTNEPDSWVINLFDKTGRHLVDSGPQFVTHAPIFWASNGKPEQDFEDLEFGTELKFFSKERGRELKPRKIDGLTCKAISIESGRHEAILLLHPHTGKPFQIDLIKFGRLTSTVRYLSYETSRPFNPSLFRPPEDAKIREPE